MNGVEKLMERKEVVHQLIEILVQKEDNARDRYFSDSSEYHHREDERLNAKIEQIKEAYPENYEDYFREAKKIANWEHGSVTKSARVEIQSVWDRFHKKMERLLEVEKEIESENKVQEMADRIRQMMKKDYKSFLKALFFVETGVQADKALEKTYEKHMQNANVTFLNREIINNLKKEQIMEKTIYVVSDQREKEAYLRFAKESDMESIRVYTWEETTRITDHQVTCEKLVLALKATDSISREEIGVLMKQVQAKEHHVHSPISESFETDWQAAKGEHVFYVEDYTPVME